MSLLGLQLGLDYMQNNYTAKIKAFNYSEDVKISETSLFLGYRLLFFRLYGAYMLNSSTGGEEDGAKLDIGYKVGASFYAFKNVALSLEMRQAKFKEFTNSDGEKTNTKYNTMALVLSFPFEI